MGTEVTSEEMPVTAGADRFARERLVPDWDTGALSRATAVVVGVGALGNEVAKNLALAGVGRLVLCDPDTVETTNLSRSVLFRPDDLGRAKVHAAADSLHRLVPGIVAEPRPHDLASAVGLGELGSAQVVLGCLDSLRSRMRLLGRCALVEAPLVDGATGPWEGEVRLRLDTRDACYGCTLSAHQRGVTDVPWSCLDDTAGAGPLGTHIATTALVASWMTLAALRTVLGAPPAYRLLRHDSLTGRSTPVEMTRAPDCPHHRPLTGRIQDSPVDHRAFVRELTAALPPGTEPLTWTQFPLPARCPRCGTGAEPLSACARCGRLVRPRLTNRLADADPEARLSELGVAPEEILPVREPRGEYTWLRVSR